MSVNVYGSQGVNDRKLSGQFDVLLHYFWESRGFFKLSSSLTPLKKV